MAESRQRLRAEIEKELKEEWAAKGDQLRDVALEQVVDELGGIGCIDFAKFAQWSAGQAQEQADHETVDDGDGNEQPEKDKFLGAAPTQQENERPSSTKSVSNEGKRNSSSANLSCDSLRSNSNPDTPSPTPQEEIRSRRRKKRRLMRRTEALA